MIEVTGDDGSAVEVTFRLPRDSGAGRACVVGEFNGWSTIAHPMRLDGDGFVVRIPIEAGRAYRFRYLLDGERWENDWAAHHYVPNEFGGDDSLLDLTPVAPSAGSGHRQPATAERSDVPRAPDDRVAGRRRARARSAQEATSAG